MSNNGMRGVRLPFSGHAPAPSPLPSPADALIGQEVWSGSVALPSRGTPDTGSPPEVTVFTTARPWRACDVSVQMAPPPGGLANALGGTLSVLVYAVTGGMRTLVASGRFYQRGNVDPYPAKWVVAARTIAQRFEVSIQFIQSNAVAAYKGNVNVSVVASNEATEPPANVGQEDAALVNLQSSGAEIGAPTTVPAWQRVPRLELVSLRAANGAAAPRYLMLFDQAVRPGNGETAVMTWPLGPAAGYGTTELKVSYRAKFSLWVVTSSNVALLTTTTDCAVTGLVR